MKKSKQNKNWKFDEHEFYGGDFKIFTTNKSNGIYQMQCWLSEEGKTFRKSLRTDHLATAISKAKDEYAEIRSRINKGKKIFSENVDSVVARYLSSRLEDVKTGLIVRGRYGTIRTHLLNMLQYLNKDMKVSDINKGTFTDFYNFRKNQTNNLVNDDTIRNEYSTIRMFIKWCYGEGLTSVSAEQLEIKKFNRNKLQANVRRDTFTEEEWEKLYTGMRTFCSQKNSEGDIDYYNKQILRNYILALANTGMRTGELEQLQWSDVLEYRKEERFGKDREIVLLQVRHETSKVRKNRNVVCRDSKCFRRVFEFSNHKTKSDLVFSNYDGNRITARQKSKFWYELLEFCGIKTDSRNITYYSLRHFFVTQRWKGGVNLRDIANACGTSVHQIEKTYYHLDEETLIQTALKDIRRKRRSLGIITCTLSA